jgi:hypothetical protein
MKKGRWSLTIVVCSLALVGPMVEQLLAAQKKAKGQASPSVAVAPPKPLPEKPQRPVNPHPKKAGAPTDPDRQPEAVQNQVRQTTTEAKIAGGKGHRRAKVGKQLRPKAEVRPRTDLMYHGLLENAQRYDPRPTSRTAGVPNPQTPDLTHDHFQELDRNQDGKIDPVERAFGRLDMDRDLGDRQFR